VFDKSITAMDNVDTIENVSNENPVKSNSNPIDSKSSNFHGKRLNGKERSANKSCLIS
jgi:hypothetical protein